MKFDLFSQAWTYLHSKCLSWPCLSIGKYADVITIHTRDDKWLHFFEHLKLQMQINQDVLNTKTYIHI